MAYALIGSGTGNGTNTFSTTGFDTTGATLLILCWTDAGGAAPTVSDSNGNTYTQVLRYVPVDQTSNIYICAAPVVGSAHTATLTKASQFASAQLWAFSGSAASPTDQTNNDLAFGSTTVLPGPVTPTEDNELVMVHCNFGVQSGTGTINGGFATPVGSPGSGAAYLGGASSWLIQTTAASADPTFTSAGSGNLYSTIATFKAAAVATGVPPGLGPVVGLTMPNQAGNLTASMR